MKKSSSSIAKNSIIVLFLTTFGSALNYLIQILMGREFSIDNYGIINTIFTIIMIINVFGATTSMMISKTLAESKTPSKEYYYVLLNFLRVILCALFVISLIFIGQIKQLLNVDSFLISLLSVITILTSAYPILYQGVYGGTNSFFKLGLFTLILPVIKLAGFVTIKFFSLCNNYELIIMLSVILIGNIISIVVGKLYANKKLIISQNTKCKKQFKEVFLEYTNVFVSNISLMIMTSIDILFLSYFYNAKDAGYYSSALMFGKIIYYFVSAIVLVLLPTVSLNKKSKKSTKKILYQTILLTLILVLVFLIPVNLFPKQLLSMVFGNRFIDAIPYIKYASIISLGYSLNTLMLNYYVGINKSKRIKNTLVLAILIMLPLTIVFSARKYLVLLLIGLINIIVFLCTIVKEVISSEGSEEMKKNGIKINRDFKSLSVILPCYNEEKVIYKNVLKTVDMISSFCVDFEIICVNDGSKDKTLSELNRAKAKDSRIIILSYEKNAGKGYALKKGCEIACKDLISFIDADLELSPMLLENFIERMKKENADVVIGSKMNKESDINYPLIRKIMSYCYYIILKLLFKLKIKDTQTGLKLFKAPIIKDVMKRTLVKRWAFDIEVLSIINKMGYKITDAPIKLDFSRGKTMGRIKIKDIFYTFRDTLAVFYRLNVIHYYEGLTDKKTIFFVLGTEAELMKMYKVIQTAGEMGYNIELVSTGQNIIFNSPFLKRIDKKITIDLTKYVPKEKNSIQYLKWFIKTKNYGQKVLKRKAKEYGKSNCLFVVHGDTLTTLMGSMMARKAKVKYAHVESGPRSYNWLSPFPEEIDRYIASKHSIINFCQRDDYARYAAKAFKGKSVSTKYNTIIETVYEALDEIKSKNIKRPIPGKYFLFTLHRQENLLNETCLNKVMDQINILSNKIKCVFIFHEQTKTALVRIGRWDELQNNENVIILDRQDYTNFINIVDNSEFVVGDGCGNQQELYYLGVPYLIIRTKMEEDSEGLKHNAVWFNNYFKRIGNFDKEYKNFKKSRVKINEVPSKIIMTEIDKFLHNNV